MSKDQALRSTQGSEQELNGINWKEHSLLERLEFHFWLDCF